MRVERVFPTAEAPPSLMRSVRELLDHAFDGEFTDDDWEHTVGGWHALVCEADAPVAHAAVVPRRLAVGDADLATGYVEGVATAPGLQGQGLGSLAMARLADVLRAEFDFGALSTSRHGFYERLGWERWRGPTYVRKGGSLSRTPDEDDGIMVLRFGPSAAVDLHAPVVCEARSGDDW